MIFVTDGTADHRMGARVLTDVDRLGSPHFRGLPITIFRRFYEENRNRHGKRQRSSRRTEGNRRAGTLRRAVRGARLFRAQNARKNGFGAIIAAAGKAAHLAGALAANTTLPVIGIPVKSSTLDGLDALLSTVQMPSGIPVATVAIDGAENAALLALQILSVGDAEIAEKLDAARKASAETVLEKNAALTARFSK